MNVLFVCTGNTCRSPMAEAILRSKVPNLQVQSAGLFALENDSANQNTIAVLKERGIELHHSAQNVTSELLDWADIVLTMTEAHSAVLNEQFPTYKEKVYTLIEYIKKQGHVEDYSYSMDINDPFGGDLATYRETLKEIEKYIDKFVSKYHDK